MNFRVFSTAVACAVCFSAFADTPAQTTVKLAQEQLTRLGYYSGEINGDLSGDAQAALTQFQIAQLLPASGTLDEETLLALGIERQVDQSAAAGGSGDSYATPETKAAD